MKFLLLQYTALLSLVNMGCLEEKERGRPLVSLGSSGLFVLFSLDSSHSKRSYCGRGQQEEVKQEGWGAGELGGLPQPVAQGRPCCSSRAAQLRKCHSSKWRC